MTVRVAEDPYALLGLVLLQRRAQGASPLGLRIQVVDLQVQVRLHLLSAWALRPEWWRVVGFHLEAEAGALLFRSPQPDPLGLPLDFLPAQQGAVEVGRAGGSGVPRTKAPSIVVIPPTLPPRLAPIHLPPHEADQCRSTVLGAAVRAGSASANSRRPRAREPKAPVEQADEPVSQLEAGTVAGARTWICESSAPHGSEQRFKDNWFADIRPVASDLPHIADTTDAQRRRLAQVAPPANKH